MPDDCPFCNVEPSRIVLERQAVLAVHDLAPVTAGHTLVLPRRHVASLYDLGESEQNELWALVRAVRRLLRAEGRPDGFTIGVNEGLAAGQSVPHAHVHVIPRRLGDVADPTGGLRAIFPNQARYWERL